MILIGVLAGGALVFASRTEPTVESESRNPSLDSSEQMEVRTDDRPAREVLNAETVEWTDLYGVRLPVAAAGPANSDDGRVWGFERSEAGAVLAAIHIAHRTEYAPGPPVFEPTIDQQVVGVDKAALLLNAQNAYEEARIRERPGPDGEVLEAYRKARQYETAVWGYRVDSYTPDAASTAVLVRTLRNGGPVYANFALTVRWIESDWRLVAPVNGRYSNALHVLDEIPPAFVIVGGPEIEPMSDGNPNG